MGAWGGGLYDGDFALDLKGTISAVLRAPLSDDEVLAELWASLGKGAGEMDALDYWVVLADQLERHGIPRPEVFERAIAIVETGEDVAMLKELEADAKTIARRRKDTAKLLFERGEALTWPTDGGNSINPYVPEDQLWKLGGFKQDGWGFGIVTEAGHHYHVLAYYAVQVLKWRRPERPTLELAVHCPRAPYHYGTFSELHMKRTKVERLGLVPDEALGPAPAPDEALRRSRRAVLRDIGLSAAFGVDAWNTWGGVKFALPAPSGTPLDPDEPDQRPEPKDA